MYETQLKIAKKIQNQLDKSLSKYEIKKTPINGALIAYLDISKEHHHSIILLTEKENFGSIYTLSRSVIDSCYRMHWAKDKCNKTTIEKICKGEYKFPNNYQIAIELDKDHYVKAFTEFHKVNWSFFCDMAHSGSFQMARRIDGNIFTPNYDKDEIKQVIQMLNATICMMAICFFEHMKDTVNCKIFSDLLLKK